MSRYTRIGMKKDRRTPLLNGFDVKELVSDGLAHFAYTGRGWICWRDGVLLGIGWADVDPEWFNRLCSFLNKTPVDGSAFVYLGHGNPKFGSEMFSRWLDKEAQIRGHVVSESRLDVLNEIVFDIIKAIE